MQEKTTKRYVDVINDNRQGLMGCAIIWVVLFHSMLVFPLEILNRFKLLGYGGVDIFFFISGIGIYFSLYKNSNTGFFYKKRVLRILPSFLPVLLIFCAITAYQIKLSNTNLVEYIKGFFGNLLFIGVYLRFDYQFNWYIQAIMIIYLISPILFLLIKKINGDIKFVILLLVGVLVLQLPFILMVKDYYLNMSLSRLPIYLLGMFVADFYLNERSFKIANIILSILTIIGLIIFFQITCLPLDKRNKLLSEYGLYWHLFILITPGLCWLLGVLLGYIRKYKITEWIYKCIAICGKHSLGIYLIHLLVNLTLTLFSWNIPNLLNIAIIFGSIILGILYGILVDFFTKKFSSQRKNKVVLE